MDSPLNNIGREQAGELGDLSRNAGLKFDHIYTSPLRRAKETARIISYKTHSPEPVVLNKLIERDFGILTGKRFTDMLKFTTELLEPGKPGYFLNGEGVETFPECLKRAESVLGFVEKNHSSGKVLLATHGDFGLMLFAAFHKQPWRNTLLHFHFGNSELLLLKEDSHHQPHVFKIDQRGIH